MMNHFSSFVLDCQFQFQFKEFKLQCEWFLINKVELTSIKAETLYQFIIGDERFPMVYKTAQTNLNIFYKKPEVFIKQNRTTNNKYKSISFFWYHWRYSVPVFILCI